MKSGQTYNDTDLVVRLKAGEVAAFNQLYAKYSRQLYLNIFKLVKSEGIAEELLQDLFVRIWENRERLNIQHNFQGYLYRMGANLVYDFFRQATKDKMIKAQFLLHFQEKTEIQALSFDSVDTRDPELMVTDLLQTLPPQRKRVFELCKIEGKSYQEASKLLGISVATINDHIVKAKRHLKVRLSDQQAINGLLILYVMYHF